MSLRPSVCIRLICLLALSVTACSNNNAVRVNETTVKILTVVAEQTVQADASPSPAATGSAATPGSLDTPAASPTPVVPTPTPELPLVFARCIVRAASPTMHLEPAESAPVAAPLAAGEIITAYGRTSDNRWVLVWNGNVTFGWVMADVMGCSAPVEELRPSDPDALLITLTPRVTTTPTTDTGMAMVTRAASPTAPPAAPPTVAATPSPVPSDTPAPTPTTAPLPEITATEATTVTPAPEAIATAAPAIGPTVIIQIVTVTVIVTVTAAPVAPVATAAPPTTATSPPTLAATPTPSPTAQPSPTMTPAIAAEGAVRLECVVRPESSVNLRSGPARTEQLVGNLRSGTVFTATGRNEDGTWLYIITPRETSAWLIAGAVRCNGQVRDLPIVQS